MKLYLIFLILLLPFIWGCGDKVQVRGKVTYEEDGSPVTFGVVKFTGEKTQAVGRINKDGTYVLGEVKPGEGITPGQYKVTVGDTTTGGGSDYAPMVYHVAPMYEQPATSGLTCEVTKRMTYDIKVRKPRDDEQPPPRVQTFAPARRLPPGGLDSGN